MHLFLVSRRPGLNWLSMQKNRKNLECSTERFLCCHWRWRKKLKPAIEAWNQKDPRISADRFMGGIMQKLREKPPCLYQAAGGIRLFTRIEQAPNPDSRVTLDTEQDGLGVPRASLHWELSSLEKRSLRKMYELVGQEVGRAGVGRVKLMDYLTNQDDQSWPVLYRRRLASYGNHPDE